MFDEERDTGAGDGSTPTKTGPSVFHRHPVLWSGQDREVILERSSPLPTDPRSVLFGESSSLRVSEVDRWHGVFYRGHTKGNGTEGPGQGRRGGRGTKDRVRVQPQGDVSTDEYVTSFDRKV